MSAITLADIEAAQLRIRGQVQHSPMPRSDALSDLCGCNVYVKLENLQRTGSFKERGALNKLLLLTAEESKRGVIASSAGNHAQGVAYHARRLGISATIVMPVVSPLVKVRATRDFGAEVILSGENYDEAYAKAREIEAERGLVFVHAFDDAAIIAGQGTMGLEILADLPEVDAVIVAVGGGGLISGTALAIKSQKPHVRLIGVNVKAVAGMHSALAANQIVTVPAASTIADGISVRRVGVLTFEMVKKYVDQIVTVDDEEVANGILQLIEREKTVAEGAGAAPMAALLHRDLGLAGKNVVVAVCGGNINVNLISRIIERGLVKDGRRTQLRVVIADRPGMLAKLLSHVAAGSANVLEVHHQRWSQHLSLVETEVSLVLETRGHEHVDELLKTLNEASFAAVRVDSIS